MDSAKRYCSLWFPDLLTDQVSAARPELCEKPFVLTIPDHGRKLITAANHAARLEGIQRGMVVADARVLCPTLEIVDERPAQGAKLLRSIAVWAIRYTPVCAIDPPDGLMADITGCAHLWGGESPYLKEILCRLKAKGYTVRCGIADTVGAAWAVARYGSAGIIPPGEHPTAIIPFSLAGLRIDNELFEKMGRLGLRTIGQIAGMPRRALARRCGSGLLLRLDQATGIEPELLQPVLPVISFQERLPCLEPICTAAGITIALRKLLDMICSSLQKQGKGLRQAAFKGFRIDGKVVSIQIGTNRGSNNPDHLLKLFEEKIGDFEPDPGIDLFMLEAPKVEDVSPLQKTLWTGACGLDDSRLAELADRIANKLGPGLIERYLPAEHYWPERSFEPAKRLDQGPARQWPADRPRPIRLLPRPERIEVAAPIPDYPPMHFRYRDQLHKIVKADGPERIEQEWWIEGDLHRDYYIIEDETGVRYWLFRSGHYREDLSCQWFLHGFFG